MTLASNALGAAPPAAPFISNRLVAMAPAHLRFSGTSPTFSAAASAGLAFKRRKLVPQADRKTALAGTQNTVVTATGSRQEKA